MSANYILSKQENQAESDEAAEPSSSHVNQCHERISFQLRQLANVIVLKIFLKRIYLIWGIDMSIQGILVGFINSNLVNNVMVTAEYLFLPLGT